MLVICAFHPKSESTSQCCTHRLCTDSLIFGTPDQRPTLTNRQVFFQVSLVSTNSSFCTEGTWKILMWRIGFHISSLVLAGQNQWKRPKGNRKVGSSCIGISSPSYIALAHNLLRIMAPSSHSYLFFLHICAFLLPLAALGLLWHFEGNEWFEREF